MAMLRVQPEAQAKVSAAGSRKGPLVRRGAKGASVIGSPSPSPQTRDRVSHRAQVSLCAWSTSETAGNQWGCLPGEGRRPRFSGVRRSEELAWRGSLLAQGRAHTQKGCGTFLAASLPFARGCRAAGPAPQGTPSLSLSHNALTPLLTQPRRPERFVLT